MYDRIDVVHLGLCDYSGDHHHCGHNRPMSGSEKMIPALAVVLLEAFTKGATLAVSVFLLWKQNGEK